MLLPINRMQRPAGGGGGGSSPGGGGGRRGPLRVTFRSADDYAHEFDDNLVNMGLFVPTDEILPVREVVEVVVVVPGGPEIRGRGEVSYTVDPDRSTGRGAQAGLGLHLLEFDLKQARAARDRIRESHAEAVLASPEQRRAVRIPARLRVRYRSRTDFENGLTRDISSGGIYLRTEEPYPIGTALQLTFVRPLDGREMIVEGEVARTPLVSAEEGPGIGMGIKFLPMTGEERQDLDRFVGYVGLRRRARTASEVRGQVQETGVEGVIQLFCDTDRDGELVLRRGEEAGRIEFKDSRVVRAELPERGVRGERAFFRMMTWEDGDFEYHQRAVREGGELDRSGAELVREGLRIRTELGRWKRRFPAERRMEAGTGLPSGGLEVLPRGLRPLAEILPEHPTVSRALDHVGRNDLDAYRILGKMADRGLIRLL